MAFFSTPYGNNCSVFADLWNTYFSVFYLTEIMHQRDDANFAALLSRIRIGKVTTDDIETLKTRLYPCPL